jgi:ABC-type sugar transport system ATPase subunit
MDEPLSNLDAKLRVETRAELVDLHRRVDSTFIYVTHDQVEAMTMGSRIAVMNKGRLQQIGSAQEVYDRPATVFVAEFIGMPPMNVLPAGALGNDSVRVGVRPEHITLAPDAKGDLDAVVRVVEHLGHETLIVCDWSGSRVVVRQAAHEHTPVADQQVALLMPAAHRHHFDAATGERVGQP